MTSVARAFCALSVAALVSTAAFGETQTAAVSSPAAPLIIAPPAQPGDPLMLRQGTNVRLRTLSELSSQDSRTGQRFDMEVAEDVLVNGLIIIPRGNPAVGEVTMIKKKGMWGKSGKLEARVLSVRLNGRDIPLRGTLNDRGDTGTAGVVGAVLVLPVAGFFVTGTSATLPAGTGVNAVIDSDIPISVASGLAARPAASAVATVQH